ncbi:MAG TPA: FISUMP domain-containing protein [Fibrobacteraceae bacterium]|nr:FISUMP domain-containing protein [Fibrobacteraceae bacterium]
MNIQHTLLAIILPISLAFFSTCSTVDKTFTDEDSKGFTGSVSGVITDKHGNTLSGVLVTVTPGGQTTVSTSGGKFELSGIAPGKHALSYIKSDYLDTTSADSLDIRLLDSVVLDSNQKLTYMYATVKGTIEDSEGNNIDEGPIGVSVENQTASATTASASFILTKVEPGNVRLFAAISGTGYGYVDTVVSPDDTLKNLSVKISRKGGTITGTVVDSSGKGVSDAIISAVGGVLQDTTGSDGSYTLNSVPSEGSVLLLVLSTTGDTVGTASVGVDEGDSAEIPAVVVGDQGLGTDMLKVLPSTVVVSDTSDTLTLVAKAVWDSDDDAPCWYLWSTDGGETWDSTRVSSYVVTPSVLANLLDEAECGEVYCEFGIQVKAISIYGLNSDAVTITVEAKNATSESSSSHISSSLESSSSTAKSSSSSVTKDWFNSSISYGTVTDSRDGQTYKTVVIGSQKWMAENLNYSGDTVNGFRTYTKGWCYGVGGTDTTNHKDSTTCDTYGRHYDWTTSLSLDSTYLNLYWDGDTNNHQGICPTGWRLPKSSDFDTLMNSVGSYEGDLFKSANWDGSDDVGFSVLPAGHRYNDIHSWSSLGGYAGFWTVTSDESDRARDWTMYNSFSSYEDGKSRGLSIRCLYDTSIALSSSSGKALSSSSSVTKDWFNSSISYGTITDSRDGQTYKTVVIGSQKWMAENMNYDTLDQEESWCYNDSSINCALYGRLYTWDGAWLGDTTNHKGVCPEGWHIPSDSEWSILTAYLDTSGLSSSVGTALRANSDLWESGSGNDLVGFSAIPAGNRGNEGSYWNFGLSTHFWSPTAYTSSDFYCRELSDSTDTLGWGNSDFCSPDEPEMADALSVRCLYDASIALSSSSIVGSSSSRVTSSSSISSSSFSFADGDTITIYETSVDYEMASAGNYIVVASISWSYAKSGTASLLLMNEGCSVSGSAIIDGDSTTFSEAWAPSITLPSTWTTTTDTGTATTSGSFDLNFTTLGTCTALYLEALG